MKNKNSLVLFLGFMMVVSFSSANILFAKTAFDISDNIGASQTIVGKRSFSAIIGQKPKLEYTAPSAKDPFDTFLPKKELPKKEKKAAQKNLQPPKLDIQGIIWGGNFPQAIINEKVVKVGDQIAGAQITAISKDGVEVLFNDTEFKIPSPGSGGVKKVAGPEQTGGIKNE